MNRISTPSDPPENAGTVQSAMRWLEPGALSKSSLLRQAFADEPALQAGDLLGAYQIEHELARGGMGVVYVAARADGQYQQRVAIKVLPGSRSEQLKELFVRERQLLADFRHQHIARLIDGGQASDGLLWCAMELVDGLTLDAHIARHQPNLHQRVDWLLQICAAVSHAHSRLLIHRDIKPSNVMIDSDGSAKLLDFGIASWSSGASESSAYSPKWASPEQIAREAVGPASDQYQLGILLEKLALPLAPSGERGAELRAIAARATQALSEQRFASVSEFSNELKCWLNLQPVPSYARSFSYQLRAAARRNPYHTALLSAALALVIGLTAFNQWRLQNERNLALAAQARAEFATQTAREVKDFLANDLLRLADPNESQDAHMQVQALLKLAADTLDARFKDRPRVAAELHTILGRSLRGLDQFEAAHTQLTKAQALVDQHLQADDLLALELMFWRADLEIAQSKFADAFTRLSQLDTLSSAQFGPESPQALRARIRKLAAQHDAGISPIEAINAYAALQPLLDQVLGADAPFSIHSLNRLAILWNGIGAVEKSELARLAHLERAEKRYGAAHSATLTSRTNYAALLRKMNRFKEALAQIELASSGLLKIFGKHSEPYLHSQNIRANVLFDLGQVDAALVQAQQVLAGRKALLGENHEQIGYSLIAISGMLCAAKRLKPCIAHAEQALAVRLKAHPIDHINVLTNRQMLANSLRELAETQPAQARERVLQLADAQITLSLDGMLKTLSEDRQELANARFRFAQIKLALGQNAQAIEPLKAAAHFYRAQLMANPSRLTALKDLEAQLGVR